MFTGIIEAIGVVRTVRPKGQGKVVSVEMGALAEGVSIGQSIAINGVCLTVAGISARVCEFDVSGETLGKSTLDKVRAGGRVNIERAMSADGRFGGHIVQGHIDGVGRIRVIEKRGDFSEIRFSVGADLLDGMVPKGSVAVDGISLTIAKMDDNSFSVAVIPTTLKETTLGEAKVGDEVNIETDIITKTIKMQIEKMLGAKSGLTVEKLRGLGF